MIKNSLGQNSGKVIIQYQNGKIAEEAIKKFDNNAVDNLVCSARPFLKKGEVHERVEPGLLNRRVYLMNLPYDASIREIETLCKEFAPIDKVVVPRDPNGLARGYAFVYLQSAKDVEKLIDFVDGRHIRSRQVRA
jgi:RNA recognition motif-containing protein